MASENGRAQNFNELDSAVQNILRAFNGTTLCLYRQWVFDGRKIPLEKMINLASVLLEKGVSGFVQSEL